MQRLKNIFELKRSLNLKSHACKKIFFKISRNYSNNYDNRNRWLNVTFDKKERFSSILKIVSIIFKSEFLNLTLRLVNGSKIILIVSDEYKRSLDFCDTFSKIIKRPGESVLFPKEDRDIKINKNYLYGNQYRRNIAKSIVDHAGFLQLQNLNKLWERCVRIIEIVINQEKDMIFK